MSSVSEVSRRLLTYTSNIIHTFTDKCSQITSQSLLNTYLHSLNYDDAVNFGRDFFGEGNFRAIGIDGSMESDEVLGVLIFYVNASGFQVSFTVGDEISFNWSTLSRNDYLSLSTAIPLWREDVGELNSESADDSFYIERTSSGILFSAMTMTELYIAYRASLMDDAKIIFLDRPLSTSMPVMRRDVRRLLSYPDFPLLHLVDGLTHSDIVLAMMYGPSLWPLPKRDVYLKYVAYKFLLEHGETSPQTLARELELDEEQLKSLRISFKRWNERNNGELFLSLEPYFIPNLERRAFWDRIESLLQVMRNRLFESSETHPLRVGDKWLSSLELNAVNLFLLYKLVKECLERRILLIGIAKDTNSSEFTRAVLPYLSERDGASLPLPFRNDRVYLTISSARMNREAPWRTLSYDAVFTTLNYVNGRFKAARGAVPPERHFIRGYYQLRTITTEDGEVRYRSPVFLYDRPIYPPFDNAEIIPLTVEIRNKSREINAFLERGENKVDNLVLYILSLTDVGDVFEEMGHNRLLYLADKDVKRYVKLMKGTLKGVVSSSMNPTIIRERFYIIARRFRELRSLTERSRRR
ncbi:MAG TPA: hypothetical protein ENF41_03095 [Candidatus Bathyarchaeota archaeon]|nr:hypothetical protein [Candidatus Bathyarchaeota archaeon]